MTLGATTLHPEVERIVLAEIERGVLPATRTFGDWNHHALDDPRLHVVFNDGRNYLWTTAEKFDVITADPIHPWSGGAAYLYTREYFGGVSEHLRPGGIACQWLPIYELSVEDVKTVVRTFSEQFADVLVWLTYYDAVLVGSNSPMAIDEQALARRMASPAIAADLASIGMEGPEALLSYFVAGAHGVRAFARGGRLNTDDNLFLEFSAPRSMGVRDLTGGNAVELSRHREPILPHLKPAPDERARLAQAARWQAFEEVARVYDLAHGLALWEDFANPEFREANRILADRFLWYAPYRFLNRVMARYTPPPVVHVAETSFPVRDAAGRRGSISVSALLVRTGDPVLVFLDAERQAEYGRLAIAASRPDLSAAVRAAAEQTFAAFRARYQELGAEARWAGQPLPSDEATRQMLEAVVAGAERRPPGPMEPGPAARP
jgi:spermidine synthase